VNNDERERHTHTKRERKRERERERERYRDKKRKREMKKWEKRERDRERYITTLVVAVTDVRSDAVARDDDSIRFDELGRIHCFDGQRKLLFYISNTVLMD